MSASAAEQRPRPGPPATLPRLHVVTTDAVLASGDTRGAWTARAVTALEAGGDEMALHLRGPRTDGALLYRLAVDLLPHARRSGASLFVNDRVDVALAVDVDGVHLGGRSLPVPAARKLIGSVRWLGASCHDAAAALLARGDGADYAFLGTIFPTPSHPGVTGIGIEGLAATLARLGDWPVIAIGGIGPAEVGQVLGAGAHGVAAVRGIWDAPDPGEAVRRYVEAMEAGAARVAAPASAGRGGVRGAGRDE